LFFLGLIVFNYPIMDLVKMFLPHYLYTTWAILILVICLLVTIRARGEKK
jgi:hypothetical protein